jgi:opacity protein-like surface antigen
MGSLKALTLAGGVAIAAATAAHAADLPAPPPMPAPVVMPILETSGWYLRGDIGRSEYAKPKLRLDPNPLAEVDAGWTYDNGSFMERQTAPTRTYDFYDQRLTHSIFVDLGIGYQFNQWLRADATFEWRGGSKLKAYDLLTRSYVYSQSAYDGSWNVDWQTRSLLRNNYRGNLDSLATMVNAYVDLGTFGGITPYVGAGLGLAYHRITSLTDTGHNDVTTTDANGVSNTTRHTTGGYFKDGKKTSFAWALMAGVSYNLTQNVKLDIGYRYANLGKARSGAAHCFNDPGCKQWRVSTNNIESHDVRIGMRWMLSQPDAPAPAAYFPAPLRSKF